MNEAKSFQVKTQQSSTKSPLQEITVHRIKKGYPNFEKDGFQLIDPGTLIPKSNPKDAILTAKPRNPSSRTACVELFFPDSIWLHIQELWKEYHAPYLHYQGHLFEYPSIQMLKYFVGCRSWMSTV
jgi:hypothetical protein